MVILKYVVAGFLVFLNIFSFLLIKCQKNDREKKILQGVAEGSTSDIEFDKKTAKPDKDEQKAAQETLLVEEKDKDKGVFPDDTEYSFPKDKAQITEDKSRIIEKFTKKPVTDLKLFLCAILGGSIGIYAALFVFRYRLRDITMMVLIPTILVLNIYISLQLFTVWLLLPLRATVFMPLFL
jgi:uncharacterized membrane protein YsdA (DUF1294 family)